jgi:ankyrin repeat protein
VRLLLDSGADPNDGQALYNTSAPVEVLELLFAYGLGKDKGGPWTNRVGDRLSPQQMLQWELWRAARHNQFEKVKLLVEHGVDVNRSTTHRNTTPYEEAVVAGNREIVEYLLQHGAIRIELDEKQRFASACATGRRDEAYAILMNNTRFIESMSEEERSRIVHNAAASGREGALRLVAELGFNLNAMILKRTPMHDAAWGNHVGTIKLLIELGADPTIRDGEYDGTPLDWAEYNHQPQAADYLRRVAEN